ncbi:hypothetical protein Taro_056002 [Colocasia esculenta]|uniref:Late embryogenesis abundant protein LEA-2 subgroup domain-containing protein n=1 Tax=Colocasia esculenta TaxID=4460 RepID=A0A843XUX8_COLES|nr:hypothetical protein [Colocasia esculenta]
MYQGQPPKPAGAYYGPAVPPRNHSKSRHYCCCLFTTTLKLLIGAAILLGVLALVLWLVLRPNNINVHVNTASLTLFNLTAPGSANNELAFDISTVVAVRNPNRKVGVYYDWLEVGVYYQDQRFSWATVAAFYQGHKNTTTLRNSYVGRVALYLNSAGVQDFEQQRRAGTFDVTLRLRGRARFGVGSIKTPRRDMKANCFMAIPYDPNRATGRTFSGTKCDVNWWS